MLSLGAVAFATPWMLLGLALLPLIWWLLRVTPPAPRRVEFPPVRILRELEHREDTPAETPWWLLLLRLATVAMIVLALAQPLLNPRQSLTGSGPLVLVLDDGWTAASQWQRRLDTLDGLVEQAARLDRPVVLLTTALVAEGEDEPAARLMPAAEALEAVQALVPKPWPLDREAALARLSGLGVEPPAEIVWLSDGLDEESGGAFARGLRALGDVRIVVDPPEERTHALLPPVLEGASYQLGVVRPAIGEPETVTVRASAERGQILAQVPLTFSADAQVAEGVLDIPLELRNRVTRLELENEASAGAVVLLDERWRRRPVGLASGQALESAQPLLSETYYLERALNPYNAVRSGSIAELMQQKLAVIVLADVGLVVGPEHAALADWVERGGVLVRFAGPKLAEKADELIPVRLRRGGRTLGGALSWSRPARLAPFDEASPFHGLAVPDDVRIRRQVLAEPSLDLGTKTWAGLEDGTPLVTADRRGKGWLVLFHTTANTAWTNLPISGLFVEMLRRVVELSAGVEGAEPGATLAPVVTLDGFGRPMAPSVTTRAIPAAEFALATVGPATPPGYYGTESARRSLNTTTAETALVPIDEPLAGARLQYFQEGQETDLKPWLLALAIVLVLVDLVASLALKGLLLPAARGGVTVLLLGIAVVTGPRISSAQSGEDDFVMNAVMETRLAYVVTGDDEVDAMSHAGLLGLSQVLSRRTSVEPADPVGVDLERDELIFFPILYWPIVPGRADASPAALAKLDNFMKTGGMIVFDTRDQNQASLSGFVGDGEGAQSLRRVLSRLDIPPLVPVPPDHVLTKSFYLIQEFPGRWTGGRVWVVRHQGGVNDGVSSLVIGAHDWAAAWAVDRTGTAVAAVVPGGARQRETAFRFGINLVMYALTGNYKADQVHVPAILERLGQ